MCSDVEPLSRKSTSANPRVNSDAPLRHASC